MERILLLLLFITTGYSQSVKIYVKSSEDNSPISEALLLLDDVFAGKTDETGSLFISKNYKQIKIIKESFYDNEFTFSESEKQNWHFSLDPIKPVVLDTVSIIKIKENPISVLNKIKSSRFKQNHRLDYFHSKMEIKLDSIKLFSVNNIFSIKDNLKINLTTPIIYRGDRKKINGIYYENFILNNHEINLPLPTSVFLSLGDFSVTTILDESKYEYTLTIKEEEYILHFKPKSKKLDIGYQGFFIVDKFDFGIIEFNMYLSKNHKNILFTNNLELTNKQEYKVLEDSFNFKYEKNEKNVYSLISSTRKMNCIQTKGNFIGKHLMYNLYNEETQHFNDLILFDFDPFNNIIKK